MISQSKYDKNQYTSVEEIILLSKYCCRQNVSMIEMFRDREMIREAGWVLRKHAAVIAELENQDVQE